MTGPEPPAGRLSALVLGGAGFIGSHLCEALSVRPEFGALLAVDDFSEAALAEPALRALPGAVPVAAADAAALPGEIAERQWDVVFHLASQTGPLAVLSSAGTIGRASLASLESAIALVERSGGRLVYASTSEIYGETGWMDEAHPATFLPAPSARQEYALTKRLAETVLHNRWRAADGRFGFQIARPFNVAGPRQRPDKGFVLPRFVVQALEGRPLTVYGDGRQQRAFSHVADICEALIRLALTEAESQTWNLGHPENVIRIRDLAALVVERAGAGEIAFVDPAALHGRGFADASDKLPIADKARRHLGWHATRDVAAIVDDTIGYWRGELDLQDAPDSLSRLGGS